MKIYDSNDIIKDDTCKLEPFGSVGQPILYQCSKCYFYISDITINECPFCGRRILK
jgi:rubrerythrin